MAICLNPKHSDFRGYPWMVFTAINSNTFYKSCGSGDQQSYYYEKTYESHISLADAEEKAANDYDNFLIEGQQQADDVLFCPNQITRVEVDKVVGDPCSGSRTTVSLYWDPETDTYYDNPGATILTNGTFFGPDTYTYMIITNGKPDIDVNYNCPNDISLYWKDLGKPYSISRHNNIIIACYPAYHVVIRFDISQGDNPLGVVVAGELGKVNTHKISTQNEYLNAPTLVRWRDDGERFVVYSSGFLKSLKVFSKTGDFVFSMEEGFEYNNPAAGDYTTDPVNPHSFVGLCTPYDNENTDNLWEPRKIEYKLGAHGNRDIIMVGMWNKRNSGENRYKIFLGIVYFSYIDMEGRFNDYYNHYNYIDDGEDMICDFAITRVFEGASIDNETIVEFALVAPRTAKNVSMGKYRSYDVNEIRFSQKDNTVGVPSYVTQSNREAGTFRNTYGTTSEWKNHVMAECHYVNNQFYVIISSSRESRTEYIKKSILAGVGAAGIGGLLSYFAITSLTGLPSLGTLAWIGKMNITYAGALIGLGILGVTTAVYYLFKPSPEAAVGTSRLTIGGGSGAGSATYSYTGGKSAPGDAIYWITKLYNLFPNTFFDCNRNSSNQELYVLETSVIKGLFNSTNFTNRVLDFVTFKE